LFIVTAKVPRRAFKLGGLLAALLCAALLLPSSLLPFAAQETSASAAPSAKGVRSNEDRLEYLSAYGWEVSSEPVATQELLIPAEMDESYQEYLTLQSQQGFSLENTPASGSSGTPTRCIIIPPVRRGCRQTC